MIFKHNLKNGIIDYIFLETKYGFKNKLWINLKRYNQVKFMGLWRGKGNWAHKSEFRARNFEILAQNFKNLDLEIRNSWLEVPKI